MKFSMDIGLDNILEYINLREEDVLLYLGGRIDDDNLYPSDYTEYLNSQIKKLNPTKIICHSHWYAQKYYEKGILDDSMKIDLTLSYAKYVMSDDLQSINPAQYKNHHSYIRELFRKNRNMIYVMYTCAPKPAPHQFEGVSFELPPRVASSLENADINLENIKYLYFDRRYPYVKPTGKKYPGTSTSIPDPKTIINNGSDGFMLILCLVANKVKNLNIMGVSAFGGDEDQSYFTEYGKQSNAGARFLGQKYFDLDTSEDQRLEADTLQGYVQKGIINNLENHKELMSCFKQP